MGGIEKIVEKPKVEYNMSDANTLKVTLLGEGNVGKTHLSAVICKKLVEVNPMIKTELLKAMEGVDNMTVGVSFVSLPFSAKSINDLNPQLTNKIEKDASLILWDIGGQKRFRDMAEGYIKGTDILFMVYSSLKVNPDLPKWQKSLKDKKEEYEKLKDKNTKEFYEYLTQKEITELNPKLEEARKNASEKLKEFEEKLNGLKKQLDENKKLEGDRLKDLDKSKDTKLKAWRHEIDELDENIKSDEVERQFNVFKNGLKLLAKESIAYKKELPTLYMIGTKVDMAGENTTALIKRNDFEDKVIDYLKNKILIDLRKELEERYTSPEDKKKAVEAFNTELAKYFKLKGIDVEPSKISTIGGIIKDDDEPITKHIQLGSKFKIVKGPDGAPFDLEFIETTPGIKELEKEFKLMLTFKKRAKLVGKK